APTTLTGSLITTTSLTLTWIDIAGNETGYRVERRPAGGAFAPIATLAASSTAYNDSGLNPGTAYEYRVLAFNTAGDSVPSNTLAVTTQSAATVPLAPLNLAAVVQAGPKVLLTWQDASSNETSFTIQRRYSGWIWGDIGTAPANSTTYLDGTSIGNVTYEYRVIAKNAIGSSDFSNGVLVNTASTPAALPATPTNLVAIALTGTRIDLSWQDMATDETAYKIDRRLAGGAWLQITQTAANVISYSDTAVTAGNTYEYRVRAARNATDGAYGNTATATTPGAGSGVPNAPTGFTAIVSTKPRVQLNWVDNSTNETAFIVQRRYTGWIWGDVGTVGPNITSFLDTSSIQNVMYEYRVVAQGAGGSSPFSNSVIVNTR
ncbi:MAG: fibronectin type III domain-containing protein, partial [Burkholderiales bacterium]|nr:fibronectin type III domain-containing protein [Phycisphaerae bacterium]